MNLLYRLFKVLCVVVATHGAVFASAQELSVVKPRKAGDFVNSIGVNTHFGYYDTTYGKYEQILKPRLLELGVKHIRDGTYNQDVVRKYREVGQAGIRLLLITSSDRAVSQAKAIGDMLWGVEAVNEPDMRRYEGGWVKFACREQQNLYQAIKRDSELNHLPVVGFRWLISDIVHRSWVISLSGWIMAVCTPMLQADTHRSIGDGVCRCL